jgi:hypothetical protein
LSRLLGQPYSRTAAILGDELDAGCFNGAFGITSPPALQSDGAHAIGSFDCHTIEIPYSSNAIVDVVVDLGAEIEAQGAAAVSLVDRPVTTKEPL